MSGRCIGIDEKVTRVLELSVDVDGVFAVASPQNVSTMESWDLKTINAMSKERKGSERLQ